jgi:t-SNARE complex subunit (syntaxin)
MHGLSRWSSVRCSTIDNPSIIIIIIIIIVVVVIVVVNVVLSTLPVPPAC